MSEHRRRSRRDRLRDVAREIDRMPGEQMYKLSRLANKADLSLKTIQRYAEKGLIEVVKVGPKGTPRVTESEFARFMGIMRKGDPER